ncbi:MAG: PEP-CTERM sorting domain-containing protein [Fimbriimonadaceae bacterium]|nr:PEP-CTERM sorting domain-containing protein [Fimbriimonadaceae bacterium]
MKRTLVLALAVTLSGAAMAQSITMATFADPSNNSANPLFLVDTNANLMFGGWSGLGLTLETPGFIGGGSSNDVTFQFAPTNLVPVIPGAIYTTGPMLVTFLDSANNPLFNATSTSGVLVIDGGVGASDLRLENVTLSGPNVPVGLTQEMFNFSFANGADLQAGVRTYTASFTSSAVVPEPASMVALGAGLVALASRRRRK